MICPVFQMAICGFCSFANPGLVTFYLSSIPYISLLSPILTISSKLLSCSPKSQVGKEIYLESIQHQIINLV